MTAATSWRTGSGAAQRTAQGHRRARAIVKRQALVMGFSDTFAVIGVVLAIAAVALLFARKGSPA